MVLIATLIGAMWGSFLNMFAWRLIANQSLWYYRSYCPHCHQHIRWYDLLPIISWVILFGKCRYCHVAISPLYPFIEILSAGAFGLSAAVLTPMSCIWYWPFASTLLITLHTDLRTYQISSWMTIWCIPLTLTAAIYGISPITWQESIAAAVILYILFASINYLFWCIKKTHTLGQGDWELIAYIASMLGIEASAHIMLGGSLITLLYAATIPLGQKALRATPLPFGAGLALTALFYPLYFNIV